MLFLVLGILPGLVILLAVSCCAWSMKIECIKKGISLLESYLSTLVKIMHYSAKAMFKIKASMDDRDDSPQTEFFDYVVPPIFLVQLVFAMTVTLTEYMAFVFINTFFVEESDQCDANNPDLEGFTRF